MAKKKKKAEEQKLTTPQDYFPRLLEKYRQEIIPAMMKKFNYKSIMQVPRITKICINMGIGKAKEDATLLRGALDDLMRISGQKPVVTRARKAISNFSIRAGDPVGARVTLRHWRMYEFLDRLINVAIARIRDFNGLSDNSFDGRGNYSFGIKEQIIFPEIEYDKVDRIRGMDITITTTARTDQEAYELLKLFGMPFKRRKEENLEEKAA